MNVGFLLLRVAAGLTLASHGSQKLFGWFGGYGLAGTGGFMEQLGFVPGRRAALLAGLAELGGGLLLALGALIPAAAALVIAVMMVATFSVHWKHGFFNHTGGYEYPLVLAVAALSVVLTGPGSLSIDSLAGLDLSGSAWGVGGALVAGLEGGGIQLALRRVSTARAQAQPQGA